MKHYMDIENLREQEERIGDIIRPSNTITVSPEEKEAFEAFCRSVKMTVDEVIDFYLRNIVRYKAELLERFRQGENAEVLTAEIADRTIRELEEKSYDLCSV